MRFAWLAVVAVAAAVALYVATLAVPLNDDFSRAWQGRERGAWWTSAHLYSVWFGRWLAVWISAGLLGHGDAYRNYPALLLVPALAQVAALRVFVWLTLDRPRRPWLVTLCAFAVLWASVPHVGEFYYWLSGALEYSMGISAAMLAFGLWRYGIARNRVALVGAVLLAVLVAGFHELAAVTLGLAFAAAVLMNRGRRSALVLGGATALGLAINLAAPGHALRKVAEGASLSFIGLVRCVAHDALREAVWWIVDPKLWASSLVLVTLSTRRLDDLRRVAPIATALAVFAWMAIPAAYSMKFQDRSASGCFVVFWVGWMTSVVAWAPWIRERAARVMRFAVPALGLAVLLSGNLPRSVVALRSAREWHRAQVERHLAVLSGRPPMSVPRAPPLFMQDDIGSDPQNWRNVAFARYHGSQDVAIAKAPTAN